MKLNRGQRVVLVIGWGLLLATLAATLSAEVAADAVGDGWFNDAPNNGVILADPAGSHRGSALIWFGAVMAWIGGSLVLLRSPRPPSSD